MKKIITLIIIFLYFNLHCMQIQMPTNVNLLSEFTDLSTKFDKNKILNENPWLNEILFSIKETSKVLDIQDYLLTKSNAQRNYVLFTLGITTGYRAGDLVKLKVRDVKEALKNGEFLIYESKKMNTKKIKF